MDMMMMFLCSIFLLISSHFILQWLLHTMKLTKKNLPPSPRKLPIIGNMHQLSSLPHHNLHELSKQHGPIMLLHFGSSPVLIISSPEAAKQVMKTHDVVFSNRPNSRLASRLLYGNTDVAMSPYGEYWRTMKSIFVLQLLSNRRVQAFRAIREEEVALLCKTIERNCCLATTSAVYNLSDAFTSLTNDVACRAAFGRKYNDGERGRRLLAMLKEFLVCLGAQPIGDFIPFLSWVDRVNGFDGRVDKVAREVDEFIETVVRERLEIAEDDETRMKKQDFLDILLGMYKQDTSSSGGPIGRDSMKALLLDVFSAGTDTSATVMEWAMSELLRHPNTMRKLQDEIAAVSQGERDINESHIPRAEYLKCVLKETLRLHPPIPLLVPRVASADVELMGYDVSRGTMCMINAWAIGRDPKYWDEPEKFKPERFLNLRVDYTGHDFQLLPFGAGRRICPGVSFAMAATELVLANLVHRFNWALPNGACQQDLDMTESPGVAIRRQFPLLAVATPRF